MMHFPIRKDDQAQWLKELEVIKRQYPYFVLPKIIKELDNKESFPANLVYQYGLNVTLIQYLINQIQDGISFGIQKVIKNSDVENYVQEEFIQLETEIENHANIPNENDGQILTDGVQKISDELNNGILIETLSSTDFLKSQGISIESEIPNMGDLISLNSNVSENEDSDQINSIDRSLLVQMSFGDWLKMITNKKRLEKEDKLEQDLLKNKWKQQKLAEAIQEENDEIPEQVFQMAVESIEKEDSLVSESLAEVYKLQGKIEQAINMYRKLILLNPEKKVYFADKIEQLQKDSI